MANLIFTTVTECSDFKVRLKIAHLSNPSAKRSFPSADGLGPGLG
jgi:hypothetical protein